MNPLGRIGILRLIVAGMLYSSVAPALEIWTHGQAVHAVCMSNSTSAHPNC